MNICSVCRLCYDDPVAVCSAEGHGALTQVRQGNCLIIEGYRIDLRVETESPGEIYKATHLASQKSVLIRFILLDSADDAPVELQNELRSVTGINHPHLARAFEFGKVTENEFYVVLEDIPGQSLQDYLQKTSPISERHAVMIARQIAEALEKLHESGVIHRAVNPANIYLTKLENQDFAVKLHNFDFGGFRQRAVAKGANGVDAKTDLLRYFSPEQLTNEEVDFKTDLYSLAVVFYEMLLGHSPYNALNPQTISNYVFNEQDVEKLHFDLRALLAYTLKQSLQKRLDLRLPNSSNLARQLRHIELIATPHAIGLQDAATKQLNQKQAINVSHLSKPKPVVKPVIAEEKISNPEFAAPPAVPMPATSDSQKNEPEIELPVDLNSVAGESPLQNSNQVPALESSPSPPLTTINFESIRNEHENLVAADQTPEAGEQIQPSMINSFEDLKPEESEQNSEEICISNEVYIADVEKEKYPASIDFVETKSEKETGRKESAPDLKIFNSLKGYALPSSLSLNKKAMYAAGLLTLMVVGGFVTMIILSWQSDAVSSSSPARLKPANLNVAERREESLTQNRIEEAEDITEEDSDIPQFQGLRENNIPKTKETVIQTHHNESLEDASSPKAENNKLPLNDKTKTGRLAVIRKNAGVQPEKGQTKVTPPIKQNEKSTLNNKEVFRKVSEPIKDVIIIIGKPAPKKNDGTTRPRMVPNPKPSN